MGKQVRINFPTFVIFFILLLLYNIAVILNIPILSVIGKYVLVVFIFMIFFTLIRKNGLTKNELVLFSPLIMFVMLYIINVDFETSTRGIMTVANQLVYLMIIYIFYNISWSEYQLRVFSYIYYLSFPVLFVLTFYAPGILNTNTIGSFAYFLSFFPLLYIVKYRRSHKLAIWVIIILTLTIVLATKTRSIQLSIIFGFITFVFWDYITSRAIFHKLYFLFIAGIGFFITIIYPNLNKYSFFKPLSEFILKYTGKSLFTGRNKIWMKLGEIIKGRIWLGHGSGVEPGTFLNTTLSAHNLYIQTGLQTGIIGILLLVLAMFFVWKSFLGARKDIRTALASCFFISILIHQVFEVTLTQNQFGIGLLQWMIIGFGLNGSLSIKNKNDSHNKLL